MTDVRPEHYEAPQADKMADLIMQTEPFSELDCTVQTSDDSASLIKMDGDDNYTYYIMVYAVKKGK